MQTLLWGLSELRSRIDWSWLPSNWTKQQLPGLIAQEASNHIQPIPTDFEWIMPCISHEHGSSGTGASIGSWIFLLSIYIFSFPFKWYKQNLWQALLYKGRSRYRKKESKDAFEPTPRTESLGALLPPATISDPHAAMSIHATITQSALASEVLLLLHNQPCVDAWKTDTGNRGCHDTSNVLMLERQTRVTVAAMIQAMCSCLKDRHG